nr:NAD-dependent epimerase/dehydratase family protein [uncultured Undibacterium sp.]
MNSTSVKHATIVGGNGFVGRALANRLQSLGWRVWVPNKNDPSLFERELGSVFYCAGLTADYLARPFDTVGAHVCLLNSIIHQASFDKLVYLSSTRVYDGLHGLVDETMDLHLNPNNPRHLYDLSKLMGESICLNSGKASVVRLSCVYHDETDLDGFLPQLIRQVLDSSSTELVVDTSPFYERDYVCLNDVVLALICIEETGQPRIYNVASGENIQNSALFSVINDICKVNIVSTRDVRPAESPRVSLMRMFEDFSWQATPVLQELKRILLSKKTVI